MDFVADNKATKAHTYEWFSRKKYHSKVIEDQLVLLPFASQ